MVRDTICFLLQSLFAQSSQGPIKSLSRLQITWEGSNNNGAIAFILKFKLNINLS